MFQFGQTREGKHIQAEVTNRFSSKESLAHFSSASERQFTAEAVITKGAAESWFILRFSHMCPVQTTNDQGW